MFALTDICSNACKHRRLLVIISAVPNIQLLVSFFIEVLDIGGTTNRVRSLMAKIHLIFSLKILSELC